MYHPHIHCIVPGGGLNTCNQWVQSCEKFFIPVKVLAKKFRGKFLHYLTQAELHFHGSCSEFLNPQIFSEFIGSLYHKDWVAYCKPPFKSPEKVVEYLGRYTHRTAISNNRILKCQNGSVSFRWRDYRDSNKQKIMTVPVFEFIRRFLLHVLPNGFTKIRHFGLLSSRAKPLKLLLCKKLTNTLVSDKPKKIETPLDLLKRFSGVDFTICPCCGIGHLARASPFTTTA